ncbi:hypothetical protein AB1Y20_019465 [Prymnesium parvum]|uniref:PNPLA domain-containing protein n=1 Tax=Prymnesium parvum TaxID=97485 RepID=A0AB34JV47_PRYPA
MAPPPLVRVWPHGSVLPAASRWPELDDPAILRRRPVGVALSGGGSRAYCASLGQLAALRQLGLLDEIRYLSSVSGGAWAAAVCVARAEGDPPDAPAARLGRLSPPSRLSFARLRRLCLSSASHAVVRRSLAAEWVAALARGATPATAWRDALHATLLAPLALPRGTPLTLSAASAAAIRKANPPLAARGFAVCDGAPYALFGAALLGPRAAAPFERAARAFVPLEISPLYVGVQQPLALRHAPHGEGRATLYGGLVETFAFGAPAPRAAAAAAAGARLVRLPSLPSPLFSLEAALAASSYFAGAPLATVRRRRRRRRRGAARGALRVPYWSPLASEPAREMLLADGGSLANPPLIALLQRGVHTLLCFANVGERLPPATEWDPDALAVHPDFSDDLPAFFGLRHPKAADSDAKWTERNAVFESAGFAPLVRALQLSQSRGRGAVAATEHTTVDNSWWGVAAGRRVRVVWFYICRAAEWEAQLPPEVRAALPREAEAAPILAARASPAELVRSVLENMRPARGGRVSLDSFPQYPLTRLQLSAEQAAALHQLSGWVVLEHADLIRRVVRHSGT